MANIRTSSVANKSIEQIKAQQLSAPTWLILVILICALVVLKSFIYIKDDKRHGK